MFTFFLYIVVFVRRFCQDKGAAVSRISFVLGRVVAHVDIDFRVRMFCERGINRFLILCNFRRNQVLSKIEENKEGIS